jgi:hypothetical protein
MEDNKSKNQNQKEYIKNYQKTRYNNEIEYKQKIKDKNKLSYDKKKDDEEFKAKQKIRNKRAYQAIKEMKAIFLNLEQNTK